MSIKSAAWTAVSRTSPLWWATEAITGQNTADSVLKAGITGAAGTALVLSGGGAIAAAAAASEEAIGAGAAANVVVGTAKVGLGSYQVTNAGVALASELSQGEEDGKDLPLVPANSSPTASQLINPAVRDLNDQSTQILSDVTGDSQATSTIVNGQLYANTEADAPANAFGVATYSGTGGSGQGSVVALDAGGSMPTGGIYNTTTLKTGSNAGQPWYEYTAKASDGSYAALGSLTPPTQANGLVTFGSPAILMTQIPASYFKAGGPTGTSTPPAGAASPEIVPSSFPSVSSTTPLASAASQGTAPSSSPSASSSKPGSGPDASIMTA